MIVKNYVVDDYIQFRKKLLDLKINFKILSLKTNKEGKYIIQILTNRDGHIAIEKLGYKPIS